MAQGEKEEEKNNNGDIPIDDPVAQGILTNLSESVQAFETQLVVAQQMFFAEREKLRQKLGVSPIHMLAQDKPTGVWRFKKPSPEQLAQIEQQLQQQQSALTPQNPQQPQAPPPQQPMAPMEEEVLEDDDGSGEEEEDPEVTDDPDS